MKRPLTKITKMKVNLMFESKNDAHFLFDIKTAKPNVEGFSEIDAYFKRFNK